MPWLIIAGIGGIIALVMAKKPADGAIGILPGKQWLFTFSINPPLSGPDSGLMATYGAAFNKATAGIATLDNAYLDSDNNLCIQVTYQKTVNVPPVGTVLQAADRTMTLIQMQQLN
jgi:hypothetical protein